MLGLLDLLASLELRDLDEVLCLLDLLFSLEVRRCHDVLGLLEMLTSFELAPLMMLGLGAWFTCVAWFT